MIKESPTLHIIAVIISTTFISSTVFGFAGGDGSSYDPYHISTKEDLEAVNNNLSACYILVNDIDLSGYSYTSAVIAPDMDNTEYYNFEGTPFTGLFKGNGYKIIGLTINGGIGIDHAGLFGNIDSDGKVENLGIVDCEIIGDWCVAALAARNTGTIKKCYSTGTIWGRNYFIGGLVGRGSNISYSYSNAEILNGVNYIGGLVGLGGHITYCYSTGQVQALGASQYVGGLAGDGSDITACYSTGQVIGGMNGFVGGFVGASEYGNINSCYFLNTSGVNNGLGTPLSDVEMQQQESYLGWIFASNATGTLGWYMLSYPHLTWETSDPDLLAGSGTLDDPFLITSFGDFEVFYNDPNYWEWGVHTKLETDIDLSPNLSGRKVFSTAVIAPDLSSIDTQRAFQGIAFDGHFNGNGHILENLTINTVGENKDYLGLFGLINPHADIRNCGLKHSSITGGTDSRYVGSLIGSNGTYLGGNVRNCYSIGSVIGGSNLGGFCGENFGNITNCYSMCSVSGNGNTVGGLCSYNHLGSTITNCYSLCSVGGKMFVGGLSGNNHGTITSSYCLGSVDGTDVVGGLIGDNGTTYEAGEISHSYAKCDVTGNTYVGGLVGRNADGTILNSYASSTAEGNSYIGGLVGSNGNISFISGSVGGSILNCYSTGSATGRSFVGGLVGENGYYDISWPSRSTKGGPISFCYAAVEVIKVGNYSNTFGGLAGSKSGSDAIITSCFWDTQVSGKTTSAGGIGKTTVEMQIESTFTNEGWDFADETINGIEDIWWINEERDYPKLLFQPFGDIDNDSWINLVDFAIMSAAWLSNDNDVNYNSVCELSGDKTINETDLGILSQMWLEGPQWP